MTKLLIICSFPIFLFGQTVKGPVEYNESVTKQKTKLMNKIFLSDSIHIIIKRARCFSEDVVYDYSLIKKGNYYIGTYSQITNGKTEPKQILRIGQSTLKSVHDIFLNEIKIDEGSCTSKTKFTLSNSRNTVSFNDDRSETFDILQKLDKTICGKRID